MNTLLTERVVTATFDSPVGPLLAGAADEGVCLLEFADRERQRAQLAALGRQFACPIEAGPHPLLDRLREELAEYFVGERREFTVPLALAGTPFQRRVWEQLLRIPYGETCS